MEFRLSKDKVQHRAALNRIMRMHVLRRVKDIFTEWRPISVSAADLGVFLNFRLLSRGMFEALLAVSGIFRDETTSRSGLIVVFPCMLTIIQLLFQQNAHVFYY
jgi:hypothetical protein